jgi:hypothetical protein
VVDAVREVRPPFSPETVVMDYAALCRKYDITRVGGGRYAGEFPRELFRKHGGITYEPATKTKSDLFRDLLPLLNSGRVVLPSVAEKRAAKAVPGRFESMGFPKGYG